MPAPASQRADRARAAAVVVVLALEAALAAVDARSANAAVLTSAYLIAPLVLALFATPRAVAGAGALSIGLAVGSGAWNDVLFSTDHVLHCCVVALASALALLSARSRRGALEARRAADSARERLDVVLGALAEAVTVHDERGKTVYANQAAVRLLGARSEAELLAAKPGEIAARFDIHREDGSPVAVDELPGRRAVRGEAAEPALTRSVDLRTGDEYWLLTKATVVHDEAGRPLAVNIIEDVTVATETERRQGFLAEAGRLLASSLDCERTLGELAALAVPALGDWCAIELLGEDGEVEWATATPGDPRTLAVVRRLRSRVAGGDAQLEQAPGGGLRSAIVAPMRSGERVHGVLAVATVGRELQVGDLAFVADLALRAGAAVESARLYAEQARTARTLQDSLLPSRLPELPRLRTAASYRPGGSGTTVGGDFYDVFVAGDDALVLVGDVAGKGVEAAARTALVRHTARTAARFDGRPSAVLRVVDAVLREQRQPLVTLACARLRETAAGATIELASGGHPLPLLVGRDGAVRRVGREGLVLGAVAGGCWAEARLELAPGETLLFYTDGATDAPGERERFGEARLERAVAGGGDPETLVARVDRAIDGFQAAREGDDRALLAIQVTGVAVGAAGSARG